MLIRQPCRRDDKPCGNHQPTSTLTVRQCAASGGWREITLSPSSRAAWCKMGCCQLEKLRQKTAVGRLTLFVQASHNHIFRVLREFKA